ncbi:unnamed protein product [Ceratitis capitata]|uniref:(Mediterranean fruit fly) hypothetical protein n=1 Tax=Ceratitis capitata TaxID=7213 RepID=A0A811V591_CERCA|nr:unnamed protein product [Ceratitis capitata]
MCFPNRPRPSWFASPKTKLVCILSLVVKLQLAANLPDNTLLVMPSLLAQLTPVSYGLPATNCDVVCSRWSEQNVCFSSLAVLQADKVLHLNQIFLAALSSES